MTIDVGNSIQSIALYGNLPVGGGTLDPKYRVRFVSNYSNKEAVFSNVVIGVQRFGEYYSTLSIGFQTNIPQDVQGYYTMIIEYNSILEQWTEWTRTLVKVKNGDNTTLNTLSYVSDNDSNEQIIYYENE